MTGPWEDFRPLDTGSPPPPWEEFRAPVIANPEANEGPWADFRRSDAPPTIPPATPDTTAAPRASFTESITRGMRQTEGMLAGAAEAVGEVTGFEGLTSFGREQRMASEEAVRALPPSARAADIRGLGDFGQWAKESIGEFLPQAVATGAGAIAGAATAPSAALGATLGAFTVGLPMGVGEVQSTLKEKNKEATAGASVFVGGTAIAALDSIMPGRIGSLLTKSLGREVAEQVAQRALYKTVAVEAGKGMSIEGVTEAIQEAIGEVAGSVGAGMPIDWAGLPEKMFEAGAKGALIGSLSGGLTGAASRPTSTTESGVPPAPTAHPPTIATDADIATATASTVAGQEPTAIRVVDQANEDPNAVQANVETIQEPGPIFYSAINKYVEEKGPNSAPAEQWLATIQNLPGVKAEEIAWLRLPEYLKKGDKISKNDLLAHIRENLIDVETLERRETAVDILTWAPVPENPRRIRSQNGVVNIEIEDDGYGRFMVYDPSNYGDEVIRSFRHMDEAQDYAQRHVDARKRRGSEQPKYQDYQLEGPREDYTELLLRWNRKEVEPLNYDAYDAASRRVNQIYRDLEDRYGAFSQAPPEEQARATAADAEVTRINDELNAQQRKHQEYQESSYGSGHWEERDVLAHVRGARRIDAEGKVTFYVEEIQSDWHQTGKAVGYKGDTKFSELDLSRANVARDQAVETFWRAIYDRHPNFSAHGDFSYDQFQRLYAQRNDWREYYSFSLSQAIQMSVAPEYQALEAAHRNALAIESSLYGGGVPNAPFRRSEAWGDLAVKRILRWAADNSFERVAFTSGAVQAKRWSSPVGSVREKGLKEFYDRIIPNLVDKWARKLGGKTGMTDIPTAEYTQEQLRGIIDLGGVPDAVPAKYIDITPMMASRIRQGFTVFTLMPTDGTTPSVQFDVLAASPLVESAKKGAEIVLEMAKRFGITKPIRVTVARGTMSGGTALAQVTDEGVPMQDYSGPRTREEWVKEYERRRDKGMSASYEITVWPDKHDTPENVYSSIMHELGHIINYEFYHRANPDVQLAIDAAYQKWWEENSQPTRKFQELLISRDMFVTIFSGLKTNRIDMDFKVSALSPAAHRYWLSKSEWMAETVGRYLVTNEKPLSVVDRFFNSLARSIRVMREAFIKKFGLNPNPPIIMTSWLDSLITMEPLDYAAAERERDRKTQEENQEAMNGAGHPEFPATPRTPEVGPSRNLLRKLGLLGHRGAGVHLAATDRYNTFYKYMLSLVQVAARNTHIAALQIYRELWQTKQLERANIMNEALETRRIWGKLPREQSDRLARFMDDYAHGRFLPEDEATAGVVRRPHPAEYRAMVDEHGIGTEAFQLFVRVQADFDRMLDRVKEVDISEAMGIQNPALQARTMAIIEANFARYKTIPYMPFMRYGEFTLTVRNAANQLTAFYTFESQRKREQGRRIIEPDLLMGEAITEGVLPEEARPMMGLPPGLLDKMYERLDLSTTQKEALQQLQYDFSPVSSFKHRFQRRSMTPGYSLDFQRAYLNYFFFGSNYLTNVKYIQPMRNQIKQVRDSARPLAEGTRRGQIANFMSNHLAYTMDPKPDWATFRQAATLWALGAVPAAATLNLSQMVVGSFPFLASKFGGIGVGDARAIRAMTKAGAQVSTYYKRGKLEGMAEQDLRALNEGVKEGIITEALAHELAAAAEVDNLKPYAATRAKETWNWVLEKSMWMFEMTEQTNRRITFRAAWRLALDYPDSRYVQDAVQKHRLAYMRLIEKAWPSHEAAAFVVAKDAVEETQYIYQQWAQPRIMRGKARSVFIFKSFVQNTLFMLWNNPGARSRSLLIMAFLGGLMGMPGGEDLRGIIKALAFRLFGKDFDIEEEARKFVIEVLDGKIPPDLVLHGAARRGFGLPAAMEMVGVPFPTFDRSKAVGLGTILPIDFGVLAGPHKDTSRAIAESAQKASGAAFGIGFNLFKFLTDSQLSWSDSKRWQLAMPRSLQSATKAYRYYEKEEEVNRFGNRVVRFDTDDTRHLMEIVGASMGYQPMRLAAQWDRIMAEREAIMYWNMRREGLMRQLWSARTDTQNYERVLQSIRHFNSILPENAALKRITGDAIRRSFQQRTRTQTSHESGTPRTRADVPIAREIQRLYPEAQVDVRTVR